MLGAYVLQRCHQWVKFVSYSVPPLSLSVLLQINISQPSEPSSSLPFMQNSMTWVKQHTISNTSKQYIIWMKTALTSHRSEFAVRSAGHLPISICCGYGLQWFWSQHTESKAREVLTGVSGFCGDAMSQGECCSVPSCEEDSRDLGNSKTQASLVHLGGVWPWSQDGRSKETFGNCDLSSLSTPEQMGIWS